MYGLGASDGGAVAPDPSTGRMVKAVVVRRRRRETSSSLADRKATGTDRAVAGLRRYARASIPSRWALTDADEATLKAMPRRGLTRAGDARKLPHFAA